MKALLIGALLITSTATFAQSFILQATGRLLTIDKQGYIYDLEQTVEPKSVKQKGKNWFKSDDVITTISATGLTTVKTGVAIPKIKEFGGTWLIGNKAEFLVVNDEGMLYTYAEPLLKDAKLLFSGSNWLVIRAKDKSVHMLTIDAHSGRYYTVSAPSLQQSQVGLNMNNIRFTGGNWLTDVNGILYVVRADGGIMNKRELGVFLAMNAKGGNFFIDIRNRTQVILDNGYVMLPNLPMTYGSLTKTGPQVAWNTQGDFFTFAESPAATDRNMLNDAAAMNRVIAFVIKQPVNEQIDPRTLAEKN